MVRFQSACCRSSAAGLSEEYKHFDSDILHLRSWSLENDSLFQNKLTECIFNLTPSAIFFRSGLPNTIVFKAQRVLGVTVNCIFVFSVFTFCLLLYRVCKFKYYSFSLKTVEINSFKIVIDVIGLVFSDTISLLVVF